MLSPGRSGLTGISAAAGLSGATGMEQVWCAGPCWWLPGVVTAWGCALLRGAWGVMLMKVACSPSVTCLEAGPAVTTCWCNGVGGHSSSHLLGAQSRGAVVLSFIAPASIFIRGVLSPPGKGGSSSSTGARLGPEESRWWRWHRVLSVQRKTRHSLCQPHVSVHSHPWALHAWWEGVKPPTNLYLNHR